MTGRHSFSSSSNDFHKIPSKSNARHTEKQKKNEKICVFRRRRRRRRLQFFVRPIVERNFSMRNFIYGPDVANRHRIKIEQIKTENTINSLTKTWYGEKFQGA